MQYRCFKRQSRVNRRASALSTMIILIVLVVIVAFVKWYIKGPAIDPDLCNDLAPWKEWKLRQNNPNPDTQPSDEQPDITKMLMFDTNARLNDQPRGEITIRIYPDGSVSGIWYGSYYNDSGVNFDIMGGDFQGMTCPAKIYQDENTENTEDTSRLYFITKGKFMFAKNDFKKGTLRHEGGDIYVTGWLTAEHTASGKITLTSNEKLSITFTWKASRPNNK